MKVLSIFLAKSSCRPLSWNSPSNWWVLSYCTRVPCWYILMCAPDKILMWPFQGLYAWIDANIYVCLVTPSPILLLCLLHGLDIARIGVFSCLLGWFRGVDVAAAALGC